MTRVIRAAVEAETAAERRRLTERESGRADARAKERRDRAWALWLAVPSVALVITGFFVSASIAGHASKAASETAQDNQQKAADTAARTARATAYGAFQSDLVQLQAAERRLVQVMGEGAESDFFRLADERVQALQVDADADAARVLTIGRPYAQDHAQMAAARFASLTAAIEKTAEKEPGALSAASVRLGVTCIPYTMLDDFLKQVRRDLGTQFTQRAVPSSCNTVYGGDKNTEFTG